MERYQRREKKQLEELQGVFPKSGSIMISKKTKIFGILSTLSLVFLTTSLSSCVFVPIIESVSEMGVTKSDRTRLLTEQVKKFEDAWYWGNQQKILELSDASLHKEILKEFKERERKDQRIVDKKIVTTDLNKEADRADVMVVIKAYEPTTLIVKDFEEQQQWEFTMSDGWKLHSRSVTLRK